MTNLATLCPGDHNAKTHGGWVHVLDPDTGALTQTSPLGRTYTTVPEPAGRRRPGEAAIRPDPDRSRSSSTMSTSSPRASRHRSPPTSKPHHRIQRPEVDRWLEIAASIRDRARITRRNRRAAQAAEQALIQRMHAELVATTDHDLIAAINAENLTEDLAA